MSQHMKKFVLRGLVAMGFGPICLAVVYLVLWRCGAVESVGAGEMVLGVLTVSVMAFFAGGLNVVYEIERLPLLYAALIHSVILYLDYAVIYLINGWLEDGWIPFLSFSAIFAAGFWLIWFAVYLFTKANVEKMNRSMEQNKPIAEKRQ